ncbi:MAG: hypothetical protein WDZ35_15045 [Crocinitomicaceae bacterium]
MENIVNIHLRFVDKTSGKPLYSDKHYLKLYDSDLIEDDFLGESTLDPNGHALVSITANDFRGKDTPRENFPDLYFQLFKGEKKIMESQVFKNVRIEDKEAYPASGAIHFDLGTFKV